MWKKGYKQPMDQEHKNSNDFVFDSNSLYDVDGFQQFEKPSCANSSKTSFLKSLSPLKDSSKTRSDSPGITSHSFMNTSTQEKNKSKTVSPDILSQNNSGGAAIINNPGSTYSISRTSSNSNNHITQQRKQSLQQQGQSKQQQHSQPHLPHLSFGKSKKQQHKAQSSVDSDADWDADIDNIGVSPEVAAAPTYPNISTLSLEPLPTQESTADLGVPPSTESPISDSLYPFLKYNYEEMMKNPFSILTSQTAPVHDTVRYNKILKSLTKSTFELSDLKKQSWGGIPSCIRALVWQILVGYLPVNLNTRVSVLGRKRKEYTNSITQLFRVEKEQAIWHQIKIDIPRTNPSIKLYSFDATHRSLERILYLWAVRHPASGYVQGINDLATPFFQVFLSHYLCENIDVEQFDPKFVPKELMNSVEADTYWCLTKVLDTIQDNYIHEQPGIIRQITELKNLVKRDEPSLAHHFDNENLDFIQFSFRWMNCMLMREFKLNLIIRMWDTYLSDFPTGFSQFHVYVCCAFLRRFSDDLMEMDFQDIIMYLQDTSKTDGWSEEDIEMMLSEAYVWQSLYENATAHLK